MHMHRHDLVLPEISHPCFRQQHDNHIAAKSQLFPLVDWITIPAADDDLKRRERIRVPLTPQFTLEINLSVFAH